MRKTRLHRAGIWLCAALRRDLIKEKGIVMEKIRIQKIIADSGFCSRRKAEEYISDGLVLVNGR